MKKRKWIRPMLWGVCYITLLFLVRPLLHRIYRYASHQTVRGWEYYEGEASARDHGKAFALTRRAAWLGNPSAKNNLGLFYSLGVGVEQDFEKSIQWFERAEQKGTTGNAQYNLGYMYYHGKGLPQDVQCAKKYFEQAAERGFPIAYWYLGEMYRLGDGVEITPEKAFTNYWQAAMLGYGPAFRSIGSCYWKGEGVAQDRIQAYAFTLISVSHSGQFPYQELMHMSERMSADEIGRAECLSKTLSSHYAVKDFAYRSSITVTGDSERAVPL